MCVYTYIVRNVKLLHEITLQEHSHSRPAGIVVIQVKVCGKGRKKSKKKNGVGLKHTDTV